MNSSLKSADAPIAGSTPPSPPVPQQTDDPYRALDDLMAVVEAFCPVWPERKSFVTTPGNMRL